MKPPIRLTKGKLLRYALQGIILGVVASTMVLLWTVESATLEHFRRFRWQLSFLLAFLIFTAWACNGCRIFILSRALGYSLKYRQSLAISLSSEFGIAATPAGMGGAVIRLSLLRRAGIPWSHGTTMLATDMVIDAVFFLLLFPFAVFSLMHNRKILAFFQRNRIEEWIIPFVLLFIMIWIMLKLIPSRWVSQKIKSFLQNPVLIRYRIPARLRFILWRLSREVRKMKEGLRVLFGLRRKWVFINFGLASLQWICRYSILPIVLYAFSLPNNPVLLFMLQGILFTASLLLLLPGGGGGVEVSTALILKLIIPHSLVGVVILLWRFFTYYLYLMGGGIAFFTTCARLQTLFPTSVSRGEEEISFSEANGDSENEYE